MPAFILLSSALLVFAVTIQLLSLPPATLFALFSSLPVLQQIAWAVICVVPISLIAIAVVQYSRLIEQRKATNAMEGRLHGMRQDVLGLQQVQNESDKAAQYLDRGDPEGALGALQARVTGTEQALQFHQERNQSGDVAGCLEALRQQQQEMRRKLGEVIGKRRSIETSISQLQSSQEEMQRTISELEEDKGETLEARLSALSEYIQTANSRCEQIERSMPGFVNLERKFDALQMRVAPLARKETGAVSILNRLHETRNSLALEMERTISALEEDANGETLENLQTGFSDFVGTTNSQCEQIERAMPGFLEVEERFGALQMRVVPLAGEDTGVISILRRLFDIRQRLAGEVEQTISVLEKDENGETLDDRLRGLSEFINMTNSRCEQIERAMPQFFELEEKFGALQMRVAPLDDKETGVIAFCGRCTMCEPGLPPPLLALRRTKG